MRSVTTTRCNGAQPAIAGSRFATLAGTTTLTWFVVGAVAPFPTAKYHCRCTTCGMVPGLKAGSSTRCSKTSPGTLAAAHGVSPECESGSLFVVVGRVNVVKTSCSNSVSFKGSYFVPTFKLTRGSNLNDNDIQAIGPSPMAACQ